MKKLLPSILIIILLVLAVFYFVERDREVVNNVENKPEEIVPVGDYVTYKSSEYSPEFTYPRAWGEVTIKEGNKICPEEDTYRTSDTLHVYDWEFSFPEKKLPGSESMIRTGIRTYELDPKNLNDCGDDFHLKIARREVDPRTISSFMLNPITTLGGLSGTYNAQASRLDTEGRVQYTFYIDQTSKIYIIQPYMSFIPYFGSPELNELEKNFPGDMRKYLAEGKTAANIRTHITEFQKMAEGLKSLGE